MDGCFNSLTEDKLNTHQSPLTITEHSCKGRTMLYYLLITFNGKIIAVSYPSLFFTTYLSKNKLQQLTIGMYSDHSRNKNILT
jgi:hypothetical protein